MLVQPLLKEGGCEGMVFICGGDSGVDGGCAITNFSGNENDWMRAADIKKPSLK